MSASPTLEAEDEEPHGCRVCQKVMHGAKQGKSHFSYRLGTVAEVMNMPCPHAQWIRAWWESGKTDSMDKPELWGLAAESFRTSRSICFEYYLDGRTSISKTCDLIFQPGQPGHAGTASILHPQWIHPSVARSWYFRCLDEHGSQCQRPSWMKNHPQTGAYPKWLIDVEQLCVVPFGPATERYLTLSYTWGQVQCPKASLKNIERLQLSGSLHCDQSPKIPQTVSDAMNITRYLGEKYLWVDSLCIIQDDPVAMSRDLNAMHLIYANSTLCLVALAGTDGNHGLRGVEGVSTTPRCVEQVTLDMACGEKLSHFRIPYPSRNFEGQAGPRPLEAAPGTTYTERGWTYQEFIFAPRRLVFTDGPLRWVCQHGKWGEEQVHDIDFDDYIRMPHTIWMKRRCPSLQTLLGGVASEFNRRHVRFQGDTLRAFLGIQNYLGGLFPGGLNYGLPEVFFDIALAWRPRGGNIREMKRRITQIDPSYGKEFLPSWSWMSWQGSFEFIRDGEFEVFWCPEGCVEPVADWFAAPSPNPAPGDMRLIKCRWHEFKALAENKVSQVPQGWRELSTDSQSPRYGMTVEESLEEDEDNQSRYPIPTPSISRVIENPRNLPFLFSKTTRAFLSPRQSSSASDYEIRIDLYSSNGEPAGRLWPHQSADVERFLSYERVELVGVAKGWTTALNDLTDPGKETHRANGNFSSGQQHKPRRPSVTPYEAAAEEEELTVKRMMELPQRPCYFALCVMWQNGWATRQASGTVLADVWERIHEPIDLVLG